MARRNQNDNTKNLSSILGFIQDNPSMKAVRVRFYRDVLYPIAKLNIEMEESNYEEFDYVNYCILKLYAAGLTNSKKISEFTGLPANFVESVLFDLKGSGFISNENDKVTETGQASIEAEQKIMKYKTKQTFQADAFTGNLLDMSFWLRGDKLYKKSATHKDVPHLLPLEYIDKVYIENALVGKESIRKYKWYKRNIVNANVDNILSVECVDVMFANNVYLISIDDCETPFPIIKTYDKKVRRWRPYFVPSSINSKYPEFTENAPIIDDTLLVDYVNFCRDCMAEMKKDAEKIELSGQVNTILANHYGYIDENIESSWNHGNYISSITMNISSKSYERVNTKSLDLMKLLVSTARIPDWTRVITSYYQNENGDELPVYKSVYVYIESDDSLLLDVANKYYEASKTINKMAEKLIAMNIKETGEDLIKALPHYINELLKQKEELAELSK